MPFILVLTYIESGDKCSLKKRNMETDMLYSHCEITGVK